MKLEYFELYCGTIFKRSIETTNKDYISNDGVKVKFFDNYYNMYGDEERGEVGCFMNFEDARLERINAYEREIARYQKELEVFKNAKNYEHYNQLHKENIKNS